MPAPSNSGGADAQDFGFVWSLIARKIVSNFDGGGVACTSEGSKAPAIPPKSPPSECTDPVKSAKEWSGCPPAIYNGFRGRIDSMKRIMKFAAFAFLVSSYPALAEEGNGTGSVRLNAPRVETPPLQSSSRS